MLIDAATTRNNPDSLYSKLSRSLTLLASVSSGTSSTVPEDALLFYAFLDPASGKLKTVKRIAARSAIVVIGVDPYTRIFVRYAWAARCSTDALMDQVYKVQEEFQPQLFGVEANAQQSLFGEALRREARWRDLDIHIVGVDQPTRIDKDFRIRTALQPAIREGRLFLPEEGLAELRLEIQAFPLGATKDLIDALASAVSLVPARPTSTQNESEIEELAAYLRSQGVSPQVIEATIQKALGGDL